MKYLEKILDVPKLILRIWLILWFILFILLGFKFCFNIWYPIVVENETFITICSFIDNHIILKTGIYFALYVFSVNFIYLSSINELKYKNKINLLIMNVLFLVVCFIKNKYFLLGNLLEITYTIILPILFNLLFTKKPKWFSIVFPIALYILVNLWQLNIYLIRDFKDVMSNLPTLIGLVMQIDYYIFLSITWIGAYFMGILSFGWLWGKSESELKTLRRQELNKKCPDNVLIAKIDKRLEKIAKREKR